MIWKFFVRVTFFGDFYPVRIRYTPLMIVDPLDKSIAKSILSSKAELMHVLLKDFTTRINDKTFFCYYMLNSGDAIVNAINHVVRDFIWGIG